MLVRQCGFEGQTGLPGGASGKLMLHLVDANKLGRVEKVFVDGREMGTYGDFSEGKWVELNVEKSATKGGAIDVDIKPVGGYSAVVSNIRFEVP